MTLIAPSTSTPRVATRDSGTKRSDSSTAAIPTGTLTKKIHSHDRYSVRTPPSSSPTAAPPTAMAAQTLSAFVRSAPSLKVVVTIDSAAGDTMAAPRPCSARATMRNSEEVAKPARNDAPVKRITPAMNRRLRPTKSAARPPSSRKPPKARVYAFTTHCSELAEKSRSSWIEGSATFTTVASSTTMNWAMHTSTRTSHLLGTLIGAAVLTGRLRRIGCRCGRGGPVRQPRSTGVPGPLRSGGFGRALTER